MLTCILVVDDGHVDLACAVALEHDVVFVVTVAEDAVVAEDDFVAAVVVADEVVLEVGEDGMGEVVEVSLMIH